MTLAASNFVETGDVRRVPWAAVAPPQYLCQRDVFAALTPGAHLIAQQLVDTGF